MTGKQEPKKNLKLFKEVYNEKIIFLKKLFNFLKT